MTTCTNHAHRRPKDRYADGRESARLLAALSDDTLTIADIASRAHKDVDETRALICALRRQGKIRVDHREWQRIPHKDGHSRKRHVAFYRAYKVLHSHENSAHTHASHATG